MILICHIKVDQFENLLCHISNEFTPLLSRFCDEKQAVRWFGVGRPVPSPTGSEIKPSPPPRRTALRAYTPGPSRCALALDMPCRIM